MSIDAILSQVTGGLNWSSLSWEILLRALLILLVGIIFNKLLLRTVDRLLLRSASLAPIQRYLRSALSVLLWLVLILVVLGSVGVEMTPSSLCSALPAWPSPWPFRTPCPI